MGSLTLKSILLCLFVFSNVHSEKEIYRVNEEAGKDAYIGNVPQDFNLPSLSLNDEPRLYSVLSGQDLIEVDRETGDMRTKVQLDRERLCSNIKPECTVNAEIFVSPKEYLQVLKVQLIVEDLNDNVPEFPNNPIIKEISESAFVGSVIRLDSAVDKDFGENSISRYEIASSPPGEENQNKTTVPYFELHVFDNIDSTKIPELRLIQRLDRESIPYYELLLYAIDGGTPAQTGTATVQITITDSNDNQPFFKESNYVAKVPENIKPGEVVAHLQAIDLDTGLNAIIQYQFPSIVSAQERSIFDLNSTSGVISIKGSGLDYENKTIHHLTVEAKDGGPNSASAYATVTIKVEDVNDEYPKIDINFVDIIQKQSNTAEGETSPILIKENVKPGTFLAFVTITDRDTGLNGKVSCKLKDSSTFTMKSLDKEDNRYYIETKGDLDRESNRLHNIEIIAWDYGRPSLNSSRSVVIELLDENDNTPNFAKDVYHLSVSEAVRPGDEIAVLTAEDLDDGENAEITYSTVPLQGDQNVPFEIRPETGSLYFKEGAELLDAENATGPFEMKVIATDNGNPPRSTNTTLIITIADENDNPPEFIQKNYVFRIHENKPIGYFVGSVSATDIDADKSTNGKVTYKFSSDNLPFNIDPTTGDITFVGQPNDLDRELKQSQPYLLTATATDHGNVPMTDQCIVEIYLLDVNDNPPIISFPNVTKDVSYIFLTQSLTKFKKRKRFVNEPEKLNDSNSQTNVNPLKDSLLIGSSSSKTVHFPENFPVVITEIEANDPDEGENGRVRFVLSAGNIYDYFAVDSQSGKVSLKIDNKKELKNLKRGCHVIEIAVKDLGKPVLESKTWVNIYVTESEPGTLNATRVLKECMNSSFYPEQFLPKPNQGSGFELSLWLIIVMALVVLLILIIVVWVCLKCKCCPCYKKSTKYRCEKSANMFADPSYTRGSPSNGIKGKGSTYNVGNGTIDSRTSFSEYRTPQHFPSQEKAAMMIQQEGSDGTIRSQNSAKDSGTGDSMPSDAYHNANGQRTAFMNQTYPNHIPLASSHAQAASVYRQPQSDLSGTVDEMTRPSMQMYPRCTEECRVYGHSDICWMPEPTGRSSSRMAPYQGAEEYSTGSLKTRKRSVTPSIYHYAGVDGNIGSSYGVHQTSNIYYDPVNNFENHPSRPPVGAFMDDLVDPEASNLYMSSTDGIPATSAGYLHPVYPNPEQHYRKPSFSHSPLPYIAPSAPYMASPSMGKTYINVPSGTYEVDRAIADEISSNMSSNRGENNVQNLNTRHGYPHVQGYQPAYAPSYPQDSYADMEQAGYFVDQQSGYNLPYEDDFSASNLILSPAYTEASEFRFGSDRQMNQFHQSKIQEQKSFQNPSDSDDRRTPNNELINLPKNVESSNDKLTTIKEEIDADEVVAQIDHLLL